MQKKAKGKRQEKYISKLRVLQTFCLEVTECLCQIPYSHEGTGKKCQGVIVQAADKVLGKIILEQRKTWFDEECQRVRIEQYLVTIRMY
jgi:hypothetical protein